jgi:hypothetical protein
VKYIKEKITRQKILENKYTRYILIFLSHFSNKDKDIEHKHLEYAFVKNYEQKRKHSKDPESQRNLQKVKEIDIDLKFLVTNKLIETGIFNTTTNMGHYLKSLEQAEIGVIYKTGKGKKTTYKINAEINNEIYRLRNEAIIDSYPNSSIDYESFIPTYEPLKFPHCSIFLYGINLKKVNDEEKTFLRDKLKQIETIFSEIVNFKINKFPDISEFKKINNKRLIYFLDHAQTDTIVCFFNVLCGYFIQEFSEMNKDYFIPENYFNWRNIEKKSVGSRYKKSFERYTRIVKKYSLSEDDLKEAFEHSVDLFYGNVPSLPGLSIFYEPVLDLNKIIEKADELFKK